MSQVQTPKPKLCKKMMNTPTNNVEMIRSELQTQRKRMGSIGHPIRKYGQNSEQTSGCNFPADKVQDFQIKSGGSSQEKIFLPKILPSLPKLDY
jgi:hypothetical protein